MVPAAEAPLSLKLRWGLAVSAAEAQLVGGESVNNRLLRGSGSFKSLRAGKLGLLSATLEEDALVLTRHSAGQVVWAIRPDGNLLGIVSARSLLQGKGGMSRPAFAPVAAGAFGALGGAALAAGGGTPAGPMIAGLAGYLNELRKALNGLAQQVEEVGVAIETGNVSGLNSGDEFLRHLADRLSQGFGQGYLTGYLSGGLSAGAAGLVGAGPAAASGLSIGIDLGVTATTMDAEDLRGAFLAAATSR